MSLKTKNLGKDMSKYVSVIFQVAGSIQLTIYFWRGGDAQWARRLAVR